MTITYYNYTCTLPVPIHPPSTENLYLSNDILSSQVLPNLPMLKVRFSDFRTSPSLWEGQSLGWGLRHDRRLLGDAKAVCSQHPHLTGSFWSLSPSSKLEHQEFDKKRPRNWTNLMLGDLSSPKLLPLVHASFKLIATSLAVHAVQSSSTILNHKDDGTRKWSAEKGQVFHSVLFGSRLMLWSTIWSKPISHTTRERSAACLGNSHPALRIQAFTWCSAVVSSFWAIQIDKSLAPGFKHSLFLFC